MDTNDSERVEEIRLWFREQGRELLLDELDGEWEAIFPVRMPVAQSAPHAHGATRRQAAENAVAEYMRQPSLGGTDAALTPP